MLEKIRIALDSGDFTAPVVQRKPAWRAKIVVTLMRANAQMVPSCGLASSALSALLMTIAMSCIKLLTAIHLFPMVRDVVAPR
jgi:hypothetical protein